MHRFYKQLPAKPPRDAKPTREQPGTMRQQIWAIEPFLANPYRKVDRAAAWQLARRLAIPHARAAA